MKKLFLMLTLAAVAMYSCDTTEETNNENDNYIYYAKLTSNKGDWKASDAELDKGFLQTEFSNGKTIAYDKSCSYVGVGDYGTNSEWPGAWKQSLEVYFDTTWVAASHFSFVTNPTSSEGGFPKCNQILSFANDTISGNDYLYFSQGTAIATNVIKNGTAMDGRLSGWHTFEFTYYYDDDLGYYACYASVVDALGDEIYSNTFGQANKDDEGLGGACIMYFIGSQSTYDADTSTHPAIVIRNQKVELVAEESADELE